MGSRPYRAYAGRQFLSKWPDGKRYKDPWGIRVAPSSQQPLARPRLLSSAFADEERGHSTLPRALAIRPPGPTPAGRGRRHQCVRPHAWRPASRKNCDGSAVRSP